MTRSISLTAPGIHSAYRRRCIAPGRFSRAASNPVNRLEPISQIGNECVARDLALWQGARRKNILHGSSTDEQRRRSGKDRQPFGRGLGGRLAALLLSHRTLGYASSSRLASRPPEPRALISYL